MRSISFPLQLRLTLFYALLVGLALLFFGNLVYTQAAARAYTDLRDTLKSRAESVRLGKDLMLNPTTSANTPPITLPSVDELGTGGVAIEVLDDRLQLIATTTNAQANIGPQTTLDITGSSPIPWDMHAAQTILAHPFNNADGTASDMYSTISYENQPVLVYTLMNSDLGPHHIIQTARSEQSIIQSLNDLRLLLWQGGILVMVLALAGGWLLTWGTLSAVRRITQTARSISASQDFRQRVPVKAGPGRDEIARLAATFNEMLANLEAAYQRQQRFVADASHELRAPITSIRCNLDLLATASNLPPAEAHAALNDAQAEADRMGRLVNDLLTLARSDETAQYALEIQSAARKELADNIGDYKKNDYQRVDLDSLVLEVFRQYRGVDESESHSERRQGPRLLLQNITPVKVYGDADQLKQVLVALLDNALKYTPYEGSVALSLSMAEKNALLKVSDTGIGILPSDLPHIFERFYRADPARSRDRGGSGLGLAIAQSIIQEHGGSIEVVSEPGKGSTFLIKLPMAV